VITWLNVHLWGPMWPNIFSPNVWTIVAVAGHLLATLAQRARHHRESRAELAAAREAAESARRIAADLYEHHTGRAHPAAPAKTENEAK
jgi:hypothetical protein